MMEYDVMILATIQTYFLSMSWFVVMYVYFCVCCLFCMCENQSSLVLTYNTPWHVMTDLFASSRFICGFGGGGVFILCPGLN